MCAVTSRGEQNVRITTASTAAALTLLLTAGLAAPAAASRGPGRPSVDGFWRMDGYGTVVAVGHGTYQEYQTTAVSCVKGDTARRTGPGTYTVGGDVLTVRLGGDGNRASVATASSAGHKQLHRISSLPAGCARQPPKDPLTSFDVFWRSFEENYPFFAAKGVDWRAVRAEYRPQVHADTTRAELFDIFSRMVRPLHDAHVAVQDGDQVFAVGRPGTEPPSPELDARTRSSSSGMTWRAPRTTGTSPTPASRTRICGATAATWATSASPASAATCRRSMPRTRPNWPSWTGR